MVDPKHNYINSRREREREYQGALEQAAQDIQATRLLLSAVLGKSGGMVVLTAEDLESVGGKSVSFATENDVVTMTLQDSSPES